MKPKPTVIARHPADENNEVVSVVNGTNGNYRKTPCAECPWRKENDGSFPAEAFRLSAKTAYDMSEHVFACHMSGIDHGSICAGFILGSFHNLSLRLAGANGKLNRSTVSDGGADLHADYRAMAEANGVAPDDPILKPCR